MPRKGRAPRRARARAGAGAGAPVPSEVIVRPVRLSDRRSAVRMRLSYFALWDMMASGAAFVPRSPTSSTDWSTTGALYDELRVRGMKVTVCFPVHQFAENGNTTMVYTQWPRAVLAAYDNDASTSPGFSATLRHDTCRILEPVGHHVYHAPTLPTQRVLTSGGGGAVGEMDWVDTSTASQILGGVSFIQDAAAAGTGTSQPVYLYVEYDVEFRARV